MQLGVLGPLDLRCGAVSQVPTGHKPRQVLALLLMNANEVVPARTIIEELWDGQPPAQMLTSVQTYILNLRKLLARVMGRTPAEIARTVLVTQGGSYRFTIAPDEFDVHTYQERAESGYRAIAAGDDARGVELLRSAQAVWRGPVLVDVPPGRHLEPHVVRLEQSKLTTIERRIESELRLGRHNELLSELASLAAQYRLHEHIHAQYMLALHRSGRRSCALTHFQRLRCTFRDELGLDPSPKLYRLQHAILSANPLLDGDPQPGAVALLDSLAVS